MPIELLVDGYNVIFECGLTGRMDHPRALENGRFRLLRTLARKRNEAEREQTLVVFDAKLRPFRGSPAAMKVAGIDVRFAVNHDEADAMIEELIRQHSAPRQLTVISSDHRLQRAARRRGASFLDSGPWWDRLTELPDTGREQAESPAPELEIGDEFLSAEEKAEWYEIFRGSGELEELLEPETSEPERSASAEPEEPELDELKGFNPFPPGYTDDLFE